MLFYRTFEHSSPQAIRQIWNAVIAVCQCWWIGCPFDQIYLRFHVPSLSLEKVILNTITNLAVAQKIKVWPPCMTILNDELHK